MLGATIAFGPALASAADDYPVKPVKIIVPFPAGGNFDTLFRLVSLHASRQLGQAIVVENRAGAGGIIGIDAGAKAPADGYTFVGVANSFTINPTIRNDLPYKGADLLPVMLIGATPLVLQASPELSRQVSNVQELLAYVRKQKRPLNYGSFGAATTPHLAMEMLKLREKVNMTHVPYKGESQAMADLQASTIDLVFSNLPTALPHARTGRMKILAMGTSARSSIVPDIPTVAEQTGIREFSFDSWYGLMAPASTPPDRIAKIRQAVSAALAEPAVRTSLLDAGVEPSRIAPRDFGDFLANQTKMYSEIMRDAKIVVKN